MQEEAKQQDTSPSKRKNVWIIPIIFFLILLGGLIFISAQSEEFTPFIYTIF